MITGVTIENFKAIHKMEALQLEPFTVFIGNNGSGKSSMLEALRLLQNIIKTDLNTAFTEWGGLDKVRNYNSQIPEETSLVKEISKKNEPITLSFFAIINDKKYKYETKINLNSTEDYYVVEHEELKCGAKYVYICDIQDNEQFSNCSVFITASEAITSIMASNQLVLENDELILAPSPLVNSYEFALFREYILDWQFLYLNAHEMGKPVLQNRLTKDIRLDYDGRNIAEYLVWLRSQGQEYLDNLITKLQFVLPYLSDLQPNIRDTFNREVELLLYETSENNKKPIPGWLLSSGTLRIVALLAMFDTPKKPSVLFIDEVENGLDPRTIGLLMSLIQDVYADKSMQVVVTTHSPYFLDLAPLESIIVSEKDNEKTYFHIPKDEEALNKWKEKFSPGKLYTMGKLTK